MGGRDKPGHDAASSSFLTHATVMGGLDPPIKQAPASGESSTRKARQMDGRVEPAHDEEK
jgi:hypothetical protein